LFNISVAHKSYYDNDTQSDSKCIGFWRYKQDSLLYTEMHGYRGFIEQDYTPENFMTVQYKLIYCERKNENTEAVFSSFAYHVAIFLPMMIFAIIIVVQKAFQSSKESFERTFMFSLIQLCMVLLATYTEIAYTDLIKATKPYSENSLSDLIFSEYKILYTGAHPIFLNDSHAMNIIFDGRMRLAKALLNHMKKYNSENNFTPLHEMKFLPGFQDGISEFDDILKHIANNLDASTGNGKDNDQSLKTAYFAEAYPSSETFLERLEVIKGENYDCHETTDYFGNGVNFHMHFHDFKHEIISQMLHMKESGWTEFITNNGTS